MAGALLALDMLGAYLFVHPGNGVFVTDSSWNFVGALGAISLTLAAVGAGRLSVDHLLVGRRSARSGRSSVAVWTDPAPRTTEPRQTSSGRAP
ncbi:MAG: DoxX family protein, partial [Actinomycetota bacterium]|nr:DoxX family protein [Actinomycetota bacterium]